MSIYYLIEQGIRPWEAVEHHLGPYATVSVLARNPNGLLKVVNSLLMDCLPCRGSWFRWHTTSTLRAGAAMQRKWEAGLWSNSSGFKVEGVAIGQVTSSTVSSFEPPLTMLQFNTLTDGGRELVLGTGDTSIAPTKLLAELSTRSIGLSASDLGEILKCGIASVLGRAYEDVDTHAVWQFILPDSGARRVEGFLMAMNCGVIHGREDVNRAIVGVNSH